jgi:hypothetical protein
MKHDNPKIKAAIAEYRSGVKAAAKGSDSRTQIQQRQVRMLGLAEKIEAVKKDKFTLKLLNAVEDLDESRDRSKTLSFSSVGEFLDRLLELLKAALAADKKFFAQKKPDAAKRRLLLRLCEEYVASTGKKPMTGFDSPFAEFVYNSLPADLKVSRRTIDAAVKAHRGIIPVIDEQREP